MQNDTPKFAKSLSFIQKHAHGFGLILMMVAMCIFWLIWGLGGGEFILNYLCDGAASCRKVEMLGAVGDIFGGVNALFAGLALGAVAIGTDQARRAFVEDRQRNQDEMYVKQVQLTFEWAFDVFTSNGSEAPKNSRLTWLTTARHLVRAQQISSLVISDTYRLILEEHTEYWRRKFFEALELLRSKGSEDLVTNYFGHASKVPLKVGGGEIDFFEPIVQLKSAEVIIAFSKWNEEKEDPIDWAAKNGNYDNAYTSGIGKSLAQYKARLDEQSKKIEAARAKSSSAE